MLMRLDLVLTTGVVGAMATGNAADLAGGNVEDIESPGTKINQIVPSQSLADINGVFSLVSFSD